MGHMTEGHVYAKGRRLMAAGWSTDATRTLISIWSDQNIQEQLDGVVRNRVVHEEVAEKLCEEGYEYTWKQCRTKVKSLTQRYRKVRKFYIYCSFRFKSLTNNNR